jgi:hypothetical protein
LPVAAIVGSFRRPKSGANCRVGAGERPPFYLSDRRRLAKKFVNEEMWAQTWR